MQKVATCDLDLNANIVPASDTSSFKDNCTARQCLLMRPFFGLVLYNQPTLSGLRKHLVIGQLNEYQFFSA